MDLQVERQAGPVEKAIAARNQGAPGLAIGELEEANRGNMSPLLVKPQLVDLYCFTGQPDRALELLSTGASEDPNLGTEPGTSFMRQGQVYFLLGNYTDRRPALAGAGHSPAAVRSQHAGTVDGPASYPR